jgi:hypothetical protein
LFDVDDRLKRLSDLGDQLEAFATAVDFEVFRPELEAALAYSDGSRGGRPPFDPVLMFKVDGSIYRVRAAGRRREQPSRRSDFGGHIHWIPHLTPWRGVGER